MREEKERGGTCRGIIHLSLLVICLLPIASASFVIQDGVPIDNGHDSTQILAQTGAGLTVQTSLAFDVNGSPVIDGAGFDIIGTGATTCGGYTNQVGLVTFTSINYTFTFNCNNGQATTWNVTNLDRNGIGAGSWSVYGPAGGPLKITGNSSFTIQPGVTTINILATGLIISGTQTSPNQVLITWATPALGTPTSYTITRYGDCAQQYTVPAGTNSLVVPLCSRDSTFTGHATFVTGVGAEGNRVGPFRVPAQNFGGDNSPLFGGNVTTYAQSLGVSVDAVKLSYASAIILILAAGGAFAISRFSGDTSHVLIGASAGGLTGLGITIAFGWIPLWAILLLLAAITLTVLLKMRGGGS